MTEQEWLECTDPMPMLSGLPGDKASAGKLRLFASTCYKHIERLLQNEGSRRAVELIELYAEGDATPEQILEALEEVNEEWSDRWTWSPCGMAEAFEAARATAIEAAATEYLANEQVQRGADYVIREQVWQDAETKEAQFHAAILRDVFGNPFCSVAADPSWLSWNCGIVVRMAQTIYQDRAFDRLPILADALEDAGCTDADILDHLRGPGPHARGCWAVDALLGKR